MIVFLIFRDKARYAHMCGTIGIKVIQKKKNPSMTHSSKKLVKHFGILIITEPVGFIKVKLNPKSTI